MTAAAVFLAAAVLAGVGPLRTRHRAGLTSGPIVPRTGDRSRRDPLALASALDVFAVCLSCGLSVSAAAAAAGQSAPPVLRSVLHRAAELLALGAAGEEAWSTAADDPTCQALVRLARRSSVSGAALADGVADLAEQSRQEAAHSAVAAAERAGVLIAGPLGLCFLPAFVCLGIVPVVAGLAGHVFNTGLL
ncbi:MAG: type II secretion system F family protein [Mycobacterium sp.]|nr:type II secretion system F family protein [Mycobacterium sp.]